MLRNVNIDYSPALTPTPGSELIIYINSGSTSENQPTINRDFTQGATGNEGLRDGLLNLSLNIETVNMLAFSVVDCY